jgi:hypothetical protein
MRRSKQKQERKDDAVWAGSLRQRGPITLCTGRARATQRRRIWEVGSREFYPKPGGLRERRFWITRISRFHKLGVAFGVWETSLPGRSRWRNIW